jgi:adenine-specific DNA glycosylase
LLQWLTVQAKGVITTAEEKIADVNSNTPVGTTQALIEQGAAVSRPFTPACTSRKGKFSRF